MKVFYLFLFGYLFSFGQENTVIVDYIYRTKYEELPSPTVLNAQLISDNSYSNFEIDAIGDSNFLEEEPFESGNGFVLRIKADKNSMIFKDHETKYFYSIEQVGMKPFLVKDTMNIFNWQLHNETKEVLSYRCQKATTNYRGRSYTAYFTTEIPIKDGPWKFYGLPGLILEVKSDDDVFNLTVNKIQISKEALNIVNPHIDSKLKPITWQEYVNEYQKKYLEYESYKGPSGSRMSLPKKRIETLVED